MPTWAIESIAIEIETPGLPGGMSLVVNQID